MSILFRIFASVTCFTVSLISFVQPIQAQCNFENSLPQNAPLRLVNRPQNVLALPGGVYLVEYDKKKCGCGMPRISVGATGVKNGYAASVKIKLKGYTCDGRVAMGTYMASNVKPGQWDRGSANAHFFRNSLDITVLRVEVEYYDEEFKAQYDYVSDYETGLDETYIDYKPWTKIVKENEGLQSQIKNVVQKYNPEYEAVLASLNKLKDPARHEEIKKRLDRNHNLFLELDKRAQPKFVNQLQESNKEMRDILSQMQQLLSELKQIAPDIEDARKQAEEERRKKEEVQRRKDAQKVSAEKERKRVEQEKQLAAHQQHQQGNVQGQMNQQQQYEQQVDASLSAAQDPNASLIDAMRNLNNAQIAAAAAGDKKKVQEIEKMKADLQAKYNQQVLNQLGQPAQQTGTGNQSNFEKALELGQEVDKTHSEKKKEVNQSMDDFFNKH